MEWNMKRNRDETHLETTVKAWNMILKNNSSRLNFGKNAKRDIFEHGQLVDFFHEIQVLDMQLLGTSSLSSEE